MADKRVKKLEYLLSLAPDISILSIADSYLYRDETEHQTIIRSGIFFTNKGEYGTLGKDTTNVINVNERYYSLEKTRALMRISFNELKGPISDIKDRYTIHIRNETDTTREPLVHVSVSPDKDSLIVLFEAFDYNNKIMIRNNEESTSEKFLITGVMF